MDVFVRGLTGLMKGPGGVGTGSCESAVRAAAEAGWGGLREKHVAAYTEMFKRVAFELRPPRPGRARAAPIVGCARQLSTARRLAEHAQACTWRDGGAEPVYDHRLVSMLYHYNRYLLLSASRGGGFPMNLQGIWADGLTAQWSGQYYMNINMQMCYWPHHAAALPEAAAPALKFIERVAEGGATVARDYYGAKGWVSHATTDLYFDTGLRSEVHWALCPVCGAWLALLGWEHWLHTRDEAALRRHALVLKGAAEFFTSYLQPSPDGDRLLSGPSTSPENSYRWVIQSYTVKSRRVCKPWTPPCSCRICLSTRVHRYAEPVPGGGVNRFLGTLTLSPTIDVAVISEVFAAYTQAAALVPEARDSALSAAVQNARGRLGPVLRLHRRTGRVLEYADERWEEVDPGHRHFSGLEPLFPGVSARASADVNATMEALRRTLAHKMGHGGGHTAWSRAWAVALHARLGDGEGSHASLTRMLTHFALPNLLTVHPRLDKFQPPHVPQECNTCYTLPPVRGGGQRWGWGGGVQGWDTRRLVTAEGDVFQIDGSMGTLAGMQEMLVQSYAAPEGGGEGASELALLPALPSAWGEGRVRGLMTRLRVRVEGLEWREGMITSASLVALAGCAERFELRLPLPRAGRGYRVRVVSREGRRRVQGRVGDASRTSTTVGLTGVVYVVEGLLQGEVIEVTGA
jgi:alpha-L-fucosidase 2